MSPREPLPAPVERFQEESSYSRERIPVVNEGAPRPGRVSGGLSLPLPGPRGEGPLMMPLGEALRRRASCRQFDARPLGLEVVSSLLGAAAGAVRELPEAGFTRRTYPAAGAMFCIRPYLVALRVEGLDEGVYRYQAEDHTLHRVEPVGQPLRQGVQAMLGVPDLESGLGAAAALVLLTVDLSSITARYGVRGYRFALQESGHLGQNLLLVAAAQGLGALPLGNFLDDCAAEVVGADAQREPVLYAVILGHASQSSRQDPILRAEEAVQGLEQQVLSFLLEGRGTDSALPALVEQYRAAGRSALTRPPHPWLQWRLEAASPQALMAGPVGRALAEMEAVLRGWWFMVKSEGGSHLRLRVLPGQASPAEVSERLGLAWAEARQEQQLTRVQVTLYEPEVFLFGGPRGMELCHELFGLDCRLVLQAWQSERRRADQLSQIWTELVLRSAGLDAFERWDVWKRVGEMRPGATAQMEPLVAKMRPALRQLAGAGTPQLEEGLAAAAPAAGGLCKRLEAWGQELRTAQRDGALERGIRSMLATCIVFHWNRMMYQMREQVFLARLWQEATAPSTDG